MLSPSNLDLPRVYHYIDHLVTQSMDMFRNLNDNIGPDHAIFR
jgi:hypothetical protein